MNNTFIEKSIRKTLGVFWFNNKQGTSKIDPVHKSLYHCLNNVKENEQVIHKSDGSYKLWGMTTFEQVSKMIEKDNHIYEVLREYGKRKVYFDIDIMKEDAKCSFTEHLEKCKDKILEQFPDARLQISGNESDKYSYHIILSNYYSDSLRNLRLNIYAFCKCYTDLGFDTSVYTKNRNMKCINQTKGFKNVVLNKKQKKVKDIRVQAYIEGSKNLTKHLIMWDIDDDAKNINKLDFNDFITVKREPDAKAKRIRLENIKNGIDIVKLQPTDIPLSLDFDYANADVYQKMKVLPNYPRNDARKLHHNIIMKVMWFCKKENLTFEEFYEWYRIKDNTIETKLRYLQYWSKQTYETGDKFLDELLEMFYPNLKKDYNYQRFEHLIDTDSKITKELNVDEYLNKDLIKEPINILGVGCGKGKTESVIQYIGSLSETVSVCILIPRITLSYDIQNRLLQNGLEFVNYKDPKVDLTKNLPRRLIISTSSLYKIGDFCYDVVVCDEFETLLNTFTSSLIHRKGLVLPSNWMTFLHIVKSADKLIVMDAITTKKTIEFIEALGKEYSFINNKREITRSIREIKYGKYNPETKKISKKAVNRTKEENFISHIIECLKNGEKCFVFMPYKEGRKEMYRRLLKVDVLSEFKTDIRGVLPLMNYICDKLDFKKGIDIEGYYAEAYSEKLRLKNVNETWKNMKCVITNTTNSVGINYELADFDKVFIYYANWSNPRDVIQVLNRPRSIVDTEMKIYIEPKKNYLISRRDYGKMSMNAYHSLMKCDIYKTLIKNTTIEENSCNIDAFKILCRRNGINFEEEIEFTDSLLYFEENDDYKITYESIKDISPKEKKELEEKYKGGHISLYEKYQLEKYNFKEENELNEPSEDNIKYMWVNRDYISAFKEIIYSEEHGIDLLLKANKIDIFKKFDEFGKGMIPNGFDLKRYTFIQDFKFKEMEESRDYRTYRRIINDFFYNPIVTVNKKDETDIYFSETLDLFKVHHRKFNNLYKNKETDCMIEEC